MRLLFVGFILQPDDVIHFKGASVAGNQMQLNYIEHLNKMGHDVDVLSFVPIAYFPKSKKLLIKSKKILLNDKWSAYSPGFINLPWLKIFIQSLQTKRFLKKWTLIHDGVSKTIISYNAIPQLASSIVSYSNHPDIKTICILADPPIDQISYHKLIKPFKKLEFRKTEKLIQKFNGIITLNPHSVSQYAENLPFIVIEGGVDDLQSPAKQELRIPGPKLFLYAGALTDYSGCQKLLDAIELMEINDLKFLFYGTGPLQKVIQERAIVDKRIIYGGYLTLDEIRDLYRQADFLINPRNPHHLISQYSFSSKLFDYLLSETPVLSTLFPGLPREYASYLIPINTDTPEVLKNDILHILHMDYQVLKNRAVEARSWLISEKNWTKQMEHLTEFIINLHLKDESMEENI